jgi:hypothetical protein
MNSLPDPCAPVKSKQDTSGERDLLLSGLRVAATRSRLQTNLFETIGIALRQKQTDIAGAIKWLSDEGLLDHVPFGPEVRP